MFRLENKIALVTGAGSGIGEAIARVYAQQGAQVVIGDIQIEAASKVAASIQESGGKALALAFDVADEAQVTATMQEIVSTMGRLDILVNNAGVSHVGNLLETSVDDWERVMRVNARGVFLCALARSIPLSLKGFSRATLPGVKTQSGRSYMLASQSGAWDARTRLPGLRSILPLTKPRL